MVSNNPYRPQPQRQSTYDYNEQQHKKNNNMNKPINSQQQQQRRTQSLSIESSSPHHDHQQQRRPTEPSTFNELPRLSIADRFMSNNNSQHSPFTSSPLSHKSTIFSENDDYQRKNSNKSSLSPKSLSKRPSTQISLSSESTPSQDRPRLTIASSFMKSDSTSNQDSTSQSSVHPLENSTNNEDGYNFDLNLDLDLPTPSNYHQQQHLKRPFGSQDTLVNNEFKSKNKLKHGSLDDEYFDIALNDYYTKRPLENDLLEEDELEHGGGGGDDSSDVSSTTRHGDEENDMDLRHNKEKPTMQQNHHNRHGDDDGGNSPKGVWIGCCFLTYGRKRPNQRTMAMLSKKKQQERNCGRRWRVFALFLSVMLLVTMTTILWPRTPLIRVEGASLLQPAKITETGQGTVGGNVQFESQWMVNFTIDNRQNWIVPTRLVQLHVLLKDSLTGNIIGKGFQNDHPETIILAPQSISTLQLGVSLDYQARDMSDATISSLKRSCTPPPPPPPPSSNSTPSPPSNNTNQHQQRSLLIRGPEDSSENNKNNNNNNKNNNSNNNNNNNNNSNNNNHNGTIIMSNNTMISNNTLQNNQSVSNIPNINSPSERQHEPLSLLFWMSLRIWGLEVFGYVPTIMVAPATGGMICPLN